MTSLAGRSRSIALSGSLDLIGSTAPLVDGGDDPSCRVIDGTFWRAWWSPGGPTTIRIEHCNSHVEVTAWGEGAEFALDLAPALIGLTDDLGGFDPDPGPVRDLAERFPGLRLPRSGSVASTLISVVARESVTAFEAARTIRQLAERWGGPAPGPTPLLLPPEPDRLAGASHYDLHLAGLEQRRGDLVKRMAAGARRLDALAMLPTRQAHQRLTEIAGVGSRLAALVAISALGDPDAVPLGDPNLTSAVTTALSGISRFDDDALIETLEPWRGHRSRVIRLVQAADAQP